MINRVICFGWINKYSNRYYLMSVASLYLSTSSRTRQLQTETKLVSMQNRIVCEITTQSIIYNLLCYL